MKPQKYLITYIKSEQKTSKAGKPYVSVGMKLAEFGDNTWINGFGNKQTASWKEGDTVELVVTDEEYNGRISKKFSIPDAEDKVRALEGRVWQLEQDMIKMYKTFRQADIAIFGTVPPPERPGSDPKKIDAAFEAAGEEEKKRKEAERAETLRKYQESVRAAEEAKKAVAAFDEDMYASRASSGPDDYGV